MNILLTGASGFVGSHLSKALYSLQDVNLTVSLRSYNSTALGSPFYINSLDANTDWFPSLSNQDIVIHAAGLSPSIKNGSFNTISEYRQVNLDATLNLAKQAAKSGIRRFIYISSIKVNGEQTDNGNKFLTTDSPAPEDAYAISKCEAEKGLMEIASNTELEVVIIRPPLIYGPNVNSNFATMIHWVRKGIPLPFGNIKNKRSFIAIDNFVSFVLLCSDRARSPKAANEIFLISDCDDISTTSLLQKIAMAYGVRSRLFPLPFSFITLAAKLSSKTDIANRLLSNLQVDSSNAFELLGWKPVVTIDEQLSKMAEHDLHFNN